MTDKPKEEEQQPPSTQAEAKKKSPKRARKPRKPKEKKEQPVEASEVQQVADEPSEEAKPVFGGFDASSFNLAGSAANGRSRVRQIADNLANKWGRATILPFDVAPVAKLQFMPWGLLTLDWLSHGIPIGFMVRIWGAPGSFKTTLCYRAIRQAQHHCRHCRSPIVTTKNDQGEVVNDCECPNPRWKPQSDEDFYWLNGTQSVQAQRGELPEGVVGKEVNHATLGKVTLPVLVCEPPDHKCVTKDGKPLKNKPKPRDVVFVPTERCEPMRCILLNVEQRLDHDWAAKNGVDTANTLLVAAQYAEQSLSNVEELLRTRQFDMIVIDSESMLETAGNLEKGMDETNKVASHANLMQKFCKRVLSEYGAEGLVGNYRPTIIITSQQRTAGIGYGQYAHKATTGGNALKHSLMLEIEMRSVKYVNDSSNTVPKSAQIDFRIRKAQNGGVVDASGVINFNLRPDEYGQIGDANDLSTVYEYARNLGVGYIDTSGSGKNSVVIHSRYLPRGKKSFQKVSDAKSFLAENRSIYGDLRRRVLAAIRT